MCVNRYCKVRVHCKQETCKRRKVNVDKSTVSQKPSESGKSQARVALLLLTPPQSEPHPEGSPDPSWRQGLDGRRPRRGQGERFPCSQLVSVPRLTPDLGSCFWRSKVVWGPEGTPGEVHNKAYLCCYYLISHCWPLLLAIEFMYVSERKGNRYSREKGRRSP